MLNTQRQGKKEWEVKGHAGWAQEGGAEGHGRGRKRERDRWSEKLEGLWWGGGMNRAMKGTQRSETRGRDGRCTLGPRSA